MANRIKGCEGSLHLTDSESALQMVADTQNMSITESAETETVNVHGDCAAQTLSSTTSYELSFDGMMSTDDAGQVIIEVGETIEWTWYMTSDQTGTGAKYSGDLVVNSVEKSFPADGRCTFSISGTGDGALVKTNVW